MNSSWKVLHKQLYNSEDKKPEQLQEGCEGTGDARGGGVKRGSKLAQPGPGLCLHRAPNTTLGQFQPHQRAAQGTADPTEVVSTFLNILPLGRPHPSRTEGNWARSAGMDI